MFYYNLLHSALLVCFLLASPQILISEINFYKNVIRAENLMKSSAR